MVRTVTAAVHWLAGVARFLAGAFLCLPGLVLAQANAPQIALGEDHVLVLHADRTLWAWGLNNHGQLGEGTTIHRATPVRVASLSNVVSIATRLSTSFAVTADGTLWAWGRNDRGQTGDATLLPRLSPVRVPGISNVVAVSSSGEHALALRSDGTVWGWGNNTYGQLGDGTATARATPTLIPGLGNVRTVRAGTAFSLAVRNDGSVWTWGSNVADALGLGADSSGIEYTLVPTRVVNLPLAATGPAMAGDFHAGVVLSDGSVWGWGNNFLHPLAVPAPSNEGANPTPFRVSGLPGVSDIAAKNDFTLALSVSRTLFAVGASGEGQTGTGFDDSRIAVPLPVSGLAAVAAFDAGRYSAGAVTQDGAVWMWGDNGQGQLGDQTTNTRLLPVRVVGPGGSGFFSATLANDESNQLPVAAFTATPERSVAPSTVSLDATGSRDVDGTIAAYSWRVSDGRTAAGPQASFSFTRAGRYLVSLRIVDDRGGVSFAMRTVVVESAANLAQVNTTPAAAINNSIVGMALSADGLVRTWGSSRTQLGDGDSSLALRTAPRVVPDLPGVVAMSVRGSANFAVRADGSVWAWGKNQFGKLGDGTTIFRNRPVQVLNLANVVAVANHGFHGLALRSDGTVWAWGRGERGALGIGRFIDRQLPAQVPGLTGVVAISTGQELTLALRSDGTVWGWGESFAINGVMGGFVLSPTRIAGLDNIRAISAGNLQGLAVRADGTVWFFGRAAGGMPDAASPVRVSGLENVVAVSTLSGYFAAIRSDGTLFTWGDNSSGELGDGTTQNRVNPAPVVGLRNIVAVDAGSAMIAIDRDGYTFSWGDNFAGRLGDGTIATRLRPQLVLGDDGVGFLRLRPSGVAPPGDKLPPFGLITRGGPGDAGAGADVSATLTFRPEDVGSAGNVYVFALAPADIVRPSANGEPAFAVGKTVARPGAKGAKADPVACVLAQLAASGELRAVSAANLQAFVSGVLSSQGAAVSVINGVPSVNIGGATFYVGYGTSPGQMLSGGSSRSALTAPGARECRPQGPQAGWWWYPPEDGRGYSIEVQDGKIFFAAFLYDASGRSKWHVATGRTSLDGSLFTGDLLEVRNGQTLFGDYRAPNPITSIGPITLSFANALTGTMVWPGGVVPLERFNIVPNGLTAPPQDNVPENGWWWNPAESGRGFFIEWQNGSADLAGYMYDEAGNPVWYLTVQTTPVARSFAGSWWSYANGQTLTGAHRLPTRINDNVAPVSIQFHTRETATLTLPGGRTTNLVRHRF